MLVALPNGDRVQVEHVERVTGPAKVSGADYYSFRVFMVSGQAFNVDGDQATVEAAHRKVLGAMSERA